MGFNLFKQNHLHLTDEELMQLVAKRGSEQAFEALYDRYSRKLVWFSMRVVGSREQAEDIVQDTFIKLIDRPEAFNAAQKFSTWIYTIVNNASLSMLRNENNRARLISENYIQINTTQLKQTIDAQLLQKRLNELFRELNEKEKSIFVLRFEQVLSIKEIALILQIPEGSVKSCIFYLLKKISQQLKTHEVIN